MQAPEITRFDKKRDRIIDQRANGYITERDKNDLLKAVDRAERRAEERAKPRRGR